MGWKNRLYLWLLMLVTSFFSCHSMRLWSVSARKRLPSHLPVSNPPEAGGLQWHFMHPHPHCMHSHPPEAGFFLPYLPLSLRPQRPVSMYFSCFALRTF